MNPLSKSTAHVPMAALLLAICSFTAAGCKGPDAATSATAAGKTTAGGATAPQKPTPEQEAAKQRAIQQGPAIEASLKLQQGK